ncbi:hypothetical protein M1N10_04885 [Thermodesulfovibrionales bacterium]|nr:hypothetical protein [Thermodesulfovibrionales bacterium]
MTENEIAKIVNPQISQIDADCEKEGKNIDPQISQIDADCEKEEKKYRSADFAD